MHTQSVRNQATKPARRRSHTHRGRVRPVRSHALNNVMRMMGYQPDSTEKWDDCILLVIPGNRARVTKNE